jgi:hypothetical protein
MAVGCILVFLWAVADLRAQELSALGGTVATADSNHASYSWELDYRQYFSQQLAASLSWINEGHLLNHELDGIALEGWYRLPLGGGRLSLSVGAGPYVFLDTELPPTGGSIDTHGLAPIFSASLNGYVSDRWFWQFMINRINPPVKSVKVNTAAFGVGYWLGGSHKPDGRGLSAGTDLEEEPDWEPLRNTATVYAGWRATNTRITRQTMAEAVEYRRKLLKHLDASLSFIYEGDPGVVRRSGIGAQVWAVNRFPERWGITIGMGFGTYIYVDKKTPAQGSTQNPAAAGGLVSPMIAKHFGKSPWSVRAVWNRIITNYSRDSDLWMLGLSYSWR